MSRNSNFVSFEKSKILGEENQNILIFRDEDEDVEIFCKDYIKWLDEQFSYEEEKNIYSIKYAINEDEEKIKIFGEIFVDNNKNNCSIIYESKKYELSSYFKIKEKIKFRNELVIKLVINNPINNLSYMFYKCSNLKSIEKFPIFEENNIINISYMFADC